MATTYTSNSYSTRGRQVQGSRRENSYNRYGSSRAALSNSWRSPAAVVPLQPTCKFQPGEVVHIPHFNKISSDSMVHEEHYGGNIWNHPAIVIAVQQVPESTKFILTLRGITSNGSKPLKEVYSGPDGRANRRTHVLIRAADEPAIDDYANPDQVIPDLRLREDSDNLEYHSYVRVAHLFCIEAEEVVPHRKRIFLTPESLTNLIGCPYVAPPQRRAQVCRDSRSRSPPPPRDDYRNSGSSQRQNKHSRSSSGESEGSARRRPRTSGAFEGILPTASNYAKPSLAAPTVKKARSWAEISAAPAAQA